MQKPENLKVGDIFRVIKGDMNFKLGEIITLKRNDGSNFPLFGMQISLTLIIYTSHD